MLSHPYKEIELDLIEYFSLLALAHASGITLGFGTNYEVTVPPELMPTLEEWKKGAETELRDPSLGPDGGMPGWEARTPAHVVEAYKLEMAERLRQVAADKADLEKEIEEVRRQASGVNGFKDIDERICPT
jgi:hypothetical protein